MTINSKSKFSPKIPGDWVCSSAGELLFTVLGCSAEELLFTLLGCSSAVTVGNKFAKLKKKSNSKGRKNC